MIETGGQDYETMCKRIRRGQAYYKTLKILRNHTIDFTFINMGDYNYPTHILVQDIPEEHPDYDKWKLEHCSYVSLFDWIPEHLPEGYICYYNRRGGQKSHASEHRKSHQKRPVICIETGKVYSSANEAAKDLNVAPGHIRENCKNQKTFRFVANKRFSYIDPFIPEEMIKDYKCYEKHKEEHKRKERSKTEPLHWYTDGTTSKRYFEGEQPEGWVLGRQKGLGKGVSKGKGNHNRKNGVVKKDKPWDFNLD